MKKQFQIKAYRSGILNTSLMDIISKHNGSIEHDITLDDIHGYVKCKKTEYPATLEKMITEIVMNELVIIEDGENVTLIVEEKEIVELKDGEVLS